MPTAVETLITVETFVEHAKNLRSKADVAERAFFEYLVWGETQTFWHDTGLTYLDFLKHLWIVDPARFSSFKKMNQQHRTAPKVGVNALHEAARFSTKSSQREVIDRAAQWEKTNERPITPKDAGKIARDVRAQTPQTPQMNDPSLSRSKKVQTNEPELSPTQQALKRLQAENQDLREENKNLRTENRLLRAQLAALKGEAA